MNDKRLADESGYRVPEGSVLAQDAGFQGFQLEGVAILQPKKKPRGGELSYADKVRNRLISSIRVRVEHAIGGVKRYRMVKDRPTVSPLLTSVASCNLLLLQSLPDSTPYRSANVRRRKDEHRVGTAARRFGKRLYRDPRCVPSDGRAVG